MFETTHSICAEANATSLRAGDLVDENEAATILCIAVRTLRNWRSLRKGPRFWRIGQRMIRYSRVELIAFIAESNGRDGAP